MHHFLYSFAICKNKRIIGRYFHKLEKKMKFIKPAKNNVWYMHIPLVNAGRYEYKFFVDNHQWVEDITNPWRVIDNYEGWNNVFEVNHN